jgi:hypothetical protein
VKISFSPFRFCCARHASEQDALIGFSLFFSFFFIFFFFFFQARSVRLLYVCVRICRLVGFSILKKEEEEENDKRDVYKCCSKNKLYE